MNLETSDAVTQEVEVTGNIIDSLLLPRILDCVISRSAQFSIAEISIGQHRTDPGDARVEIQAASPVGSPC